MKKFRYIIPVLLLFISGKLISQTFNADVDEMPKFVLNGTIKNESEFIKWIFAKVHYHEYLKKHNIQGQIVLGYEVDQTGKVVNVKVLKSINPVLDKMIVEAMEESPAWIPAKKR